MKAVYVLPLPDVEDPPTWFYHVAVNGTECHRGPQKGCVACSRLKPLKPPRLRPESLSYEEAIALIEARWAKCAHCDAELSRRNTTGYCHKCWQRRKKEVENVTYEDLCDE